MKKLLLLLLLCQPLRAAVTFDATSGTTGGNVSTLSWSHTTGGSCANAIILVAVHWQWSGSAGSVSSITYNSLALTAVDTMDNPDGQRDVAIWRRLAPSTGANTVQITMNSTKNTLVGTALTYCGVNQTTPLGTAAKAEGSGDPVTVAVTSASGELVVDAANYERDVSNTATVGAGQTSRTNTFFGNTVYMGSDEAGAASVTMSWAISQANYWVTVGVPLKPAAGAANSVPLLMSNKRRRSQ